MSDVRARLGRLLARFDDDAWVALANRGLLRRATKDLAALEVSVVAESDDVVDVVVGDHTVTMPATGPADATCTCPSPVTCQHVLTAGLWLQRAGEEHAGEEQEGGEQEGDDRLDAARLHEELMALDVPALVEHAGKAGVRWADQFLTDLDEPPALARDGYPVVSFRRPDVVARYLGGGPGGVILDQTVPHPARQQVAAVLAWQRGHGLQLDLPQPPRRAPGAVETARVDFRDRLLTSVAVLLVDIVRVGVSHLSPAIHERLTTAAVGAQGTDHHRLARGLRRLADQVELQLARSAAADDLQLLGEVAVLHGLVTALRGDGPVPEALVGKARTAYQAVRSVELIGLGGLPWRSATGYHGLTCVFHSPSRDRFVTWTDTRPESLPGFDPRERWGQPAPWPGLGTPGESAGRLVTLTGAQLSGDGRLSGVETTHARVRAVGAAELTSRLPVHSDFAGLEDALGLGGRSLLDPPERSSAWAVLAPATFHRPVFDPAAQVLTWPLADAAAVPVLLEVPWARHLAHVIGRIEALAPQPGTLVVARLRRRRGRLVGEPLSVLPPDSDRPVDCLHFDPGPPSSLVTSLEDAGAPDRDLDERDERPPDLPRPLLDLRALLERQAQRGCAGTAPGVVHRELAARHRALRDHGWPVFVDPDPALDPAEAVLRSHYLVQQCELLLG